MQVSATTAPAHTAAIAVTGVLCRSAVVEIGWPEEREFDAVTALRNRPTVRQRFLDPRPLELEANRQWLRSGMRRPHEALLAIRERATGALLGMVGWSDWDREAGSLELGRIVVDAQAVRHHCRAGGMPEGGIGLHASTLLRDFGFERMQLQVLRSVYIGDNAHSARLVRLAGGRITGTTREMRRDGSIVETIHAEITRNEWQHRGRTSGNE